MPHPTDIFPSSVRDKLFQTNRGDICLCLHEAWPSLLIDLGLLGPALLISRSEQIALATALPCIDFQPVPGTTEMLELRSGLCLETLHLGSVIAGQEVHTGQLSLHFFDHQGLGLLKIVLVPGADLDGFTQLVSHYARGPLGPDSWRPAPPRPFLQGAVMAREKSHLQKAWASFPPALGGDFLPGGHGVSWLDALQLAGRERAVFLTKTGLTKAILAAHRAQLRLRFHAWCKGIHHEATLVPRRLERCCQCLHLLDIESEAHFFLESDSHLWAGFHGDDQTPAIHIFSAQGERRGLIQLSGSKSEKELWQQAVLGTAGVIRPLL